MGYMVITEPEKGQFAGHFEETEEQAIQSAEQFKQKYGVKAWIVEGKPKEKHLTHKILDKLDNQRKKGTTKREGKLKSKLEKYYSDYKEKKNMSWADKTIEREQKEIATAVQEFKEINKRPPTPSEIETIMNDIHNQTKARTYKNLNKENRKAQELREKEVEGYGQALGKIIKSHMQSKKVKTAKKAHSTHGRRIRGEAKKHYKKMDWKRLLT